MDYQFIMNVAQIITGLATLLVAFVLLYQLRQQHRDAQRELVLAINEQRQSLAISLADNPELSEINNRGGHDFNDLKNQEERTRFFRIFAGFLIFIGTDLFGQTLFLIIGIFFRSLLT